MRRHDHGPRSRETPLKITVVLDRPRTGGAEMQAFSLMRELRLRGHHLDLLCLNADTGAAIDLPPDIPRTHLGSERTFDVGGWRRVAEWLKAWGPDLIYGSNTMPIVTLGGARMWLRPYLAAADIGVLDNLGSHKGKAARAAVRARVGRIIFLRPYSPDLNPIEQVSPSSNT